MELIKKPFYFLRHGETDWNLNGLCMGQQDIPLNERGRKQAENAKQLLNLPIECIYYSPLKRASETMSIITANNKCPKISSEYLKEWHFGSWEGTVWAQYNIETPEQIVPPNGESRQQFFSRVISGINESLAKHKKPVLFIGHSGIYWALCYYANNHDSLNIDHCSPVQFIPNNNNWIIK